MPFTNNTSLVIRQSDSPLPATTIIEWLRKLRPHAYVDLSHYAVACVIETMIDGKYIYTGGVNVENDEHHKLGIHAEQNALATLQTFLGGYVNFSRVWVMAAPDSVNAGDNDPLADEFALCCGHCRQILLSFANPDSIVIPVSCNGALSTPYHMKKLLPDAFCEHHLSLSVVKENNHETNKIIALYENNFSALTIPNIFNSLKPHIITRDFATSPLDAVILKLTNGHYIPGVLVQDIAFLTTDAIYTVLGHSITRFSANNVQICEVHLYSDEKNASELSAWLAYSEIKLLQKFGSTHLPIFYYQAERGLISQTTLYEVAKNKLENDFFPTAIKKSAALA